MLLSGKICAFTCLLCFASIGAFTTFSWISSLYQESFPPRNISLCGCDTCVVEYDPWFTGMMRTCPAPFLGIQNNISEDSFNWWKRIQYERRSFSFYNTTVDKLYEVFPATPDYAQLSPDHCRTCAVVGNSGNLIGSHYGPLIDFHDIIIRMNRSPTKGFEKDVGNRTTHRVMYPHSSIDLDNSTHLVLFPFKISDLEWLLNSFTEGKKRPAHSGVKANKDLVMILSPAFMKYVHQTWLSRKGRYPSTGFLTVILSMHMCDEVNVFGFGADRYGNWNHYFEVIKNKKLKTGHHPGDIEFKFIQRLHQQHKIHFYRGW